MEVQETIERKKASDFPPELWEIFDEYVHGDEAEWSTPSLFACPSSRQECRSTAPRPWLRMFLRMFQRSKRPCFSISPTWMTGSTACGRPNETALKAAGVKYQMFKYPGTQHGFHNDTTPRYDEVAAKLRGSGRWIISTRS